MKIIIPVLIGAVVAVSGCISQAKKMGGTHEAQPPKTGTQLVFSSFDGGGPEFKVVLDSDIVTYESKRVYDKADHEEMTGAGYNVVYTFTGVRTGETKMKIEERSPIAGDYDHFYTVKVDDELNVSIEEQQESRPESPVPMIVIKANDRVFYANPEDNASAKAFVEKLSEERIEVDMHDYGNFEKVGDLPWTLPTSDESITTQPGDVILYGGDKITLYYDKNTWDFTRLAKIDNTTKEQLLEVLGSGDVSVSFEVEWSE